MLGLATVKVNIESLEKRWVQGADKVMLADEQPLLVRPALLEQMGADITRLRDDVERSAKRLARLEALLNKPAAPAAPLPPFLDR